MTTLRFSADNSEVRFNLPAAVDLTGAFTLAQLVRVRVLGSGWHALQGHHTTGNVPNLAAEIDADGGGAANRLNLNINNGATNSTCTTNIPNTTDWLILAISKASGSVAPRMHLKNITTGAASAHTNGATSVGNPSSCSGGTIRIGEWADLDDLNANVAVIGGWAADLGDSGFDALFTNLRTSDWTGHATVPKYVHELTSKTVIPDLMGNGATLNVVNGTTEDTGSDPPGWNFNGTGAAAPTVKKLAALGVG